MDRNMVEENLEASNKIVNDILTSKLNDILEFEYNMVTHSRDFSHELVTYQLFNY